MTNTQRFELDIKKPTYPSLSVVNGDTANVFVVKITDDGKEVELSTTLHKVVAVFTRSDGQKYAQDADSGLSFNEYGEVTINVRPASFRTGKNRIVLQVYEREDSSATTYPLLCTTCEAEFMARSAALDGDAPNAPPQLPMLEKLIAEATALLPIYITLSNMLYIQSNMYSAEISAADKAVIDGLVSAYIDASDKRLPSAELYRLRAYYANPFSAGGVLMTPLTWFKVTDAYNYSLMFGGESQGFFPPQTLIECVAGALTIYVNNN